jgi:hypothetical protein
MAQCNLITFLHYKYTLNKKAHTLFYSLVFFVSLGSISFAQNVKIRGNAHKSYRGRIIQLYTLSDFVTNIPQKETQDTIGYEGYFELAFQSDITQPVILKIQNVTAQLYVQPDFVYGITIPELDSTAVYANDAELPVNIGVIGNDSTELNALIFDYENVYTNMFSSGEKRYLSRPLMFKRADSLKKICDKRYAGIKNPYFKSYYTYSIASINASLSRGENYLISTYVIGQKIEYKHKEYMHFFGDCFSGYLNAVASRRKGTTLYHIINDQADLELLDEFMKKEKFMANDSLRELVILKNLWEMYYSADFEPEAVKKIVSDISVVTKNTQHKKVCGDMLTFFNKMQPGSPAPLLQGRGKDGKIYEATQFKGKYIYVNFFSTKNSESLKEMFKIAALRKKFGDKLVFLSVCVDDSLKAYTQFLKQNPKIDWPVWFNYDKNIKNFAKTNYCVSGTEAYFLINNTGYLAASPAASPTGGIEYKLNSLLAVKKKPVKPGIR